MLHKKGKQILLKAAGECVDEWEKKNNT